MSLAVQAPEGPVPLMDPLQIALIALLPKDGAGRTVEWLAAAAGITKERVTAALMDPYLDHLVDFDVCTDSYSLPGRGATATDRTPTESTSERNEG